MDPPKYFKTEWIILQMKSINILSAKSESYIHTINYLLR